MFFGLTNFSATFQALMNTIFVDLVAAGNVAIYLDNILVYSHMPSDHRQTTYEVLSRLAAYDLYLRPKKCEFDCNRIEYFSLIIQQGKVTMDPVKVQAIADWPPS